MKSGAVSQQEYQTELQNNLSAQADVSAAQASVATPSTPAVATIAVMLVPNEGLGEAIFSRSERHMRKAIAAWPNIVSAGLAFTVIGVGNILVDVAYAYLDPRIRLGASAA